MSNMNFITSIMHLPENSLKLIDDHTFLLTLPVKSHACPHCQTQTLKIHDYRHQPVKTLLLSNTEFLLVYRRRRYRCSSCGKAFSEQNSLLSKYQRMSRELIAKILQEHGFLVTSTDIAHRYKLSISTVQRLFKSVSPASSNLSSSISIDEFKGNAGAKFQVVINDLNNYTCLNIIEDRSPDILYAKILAYPLAERLKVKHVSIDLSSSFRKMAKECFPNAKIAADKFHAVRMANDALNTIRKQVQSNLPENQRRYFKRARYLMLTREKNLSNDEDRAALQVMLNYSEDLSAAYAMKEVYFDLLDSKDSKQFIQKLKGFQAAVEKQNLKPFQTLWNTTIQWKTEILHAIATGYNNGFTEGCNTTIKNLKRICYSYRNFDNFKRRIIYLLNNPERRKVRKKRIFTEICI
ncbi:ISL3 family transposase [Anaerosinus massiliensis]|uniref:ISL3 family transposase n=1 Tax=Massilibacillus massiliensis TaxID=1806837 RepID=UPI000DA614C7|nr:ISL3 family transposase [Massilibacillus massiliensis]